MGGYGIAHCDAKRGLEVRSASRSNQQMRGKYLSDHLVAELRALGLHLAKAEVDVPLLDTILDQLVLFPPGSAIRVDEAIRGVPGLFWPSYLSPDASIVGSVWARGLSIEKVRHAHMQALETCPDLAGLFLFHSDGFLRQAALDRINKVPFSFFLAAIGLRLNDWVPEVREAARRCGQRAFGAASPKLVGEAGLLLLGRRQEWLRGDQVKLVDDIFALSENQKAVAEIIIQRQDIWVSRAFDAALSKGILDCWLLQIAEEAVSSSVRLKAWRTLIVGEARWRVGYDRKWIDKTFNLSRRVPRFATRAIDRPIPSEQAIARASQDSSPAVRRVAADALVKCRHQVVDLTSLVAPLLADRNPTIRERAEFIAEDMGIAVLQSQT